MRSVVFKFRSTVSPEQPDAVLAQINTWEGVSKAGHLKPDARSPEVLRLCYAYIEDNANLAALVERLSRLPEIESASPPAERRLI